MPDPATHFEFTRSRVDAATCPTGKEQAFFWDTRQPGLGLRVAAGGRRTFIFEAKLGRQTIRMTIGPASMPIRVPKDRKGNPTGPGADGEALRLMSFIKAGTDPRAEKAATMAQDAADRGAAKVERQRQQLTGLDAWGDYCKARAPHWSPRHALNHAVMVQAGGEPRKRSKVATTQPGILRALLARPLAQVDGEAIEAWLQAEGAARPAVTALAFRQLAAFLRWCGEHAEFSAIAQAGAHAPRRVRELVPEAGTKDDCLQREQLPLWFDAVRKLSNPVPAAFLQVALLTGARREELAGLRWEDVDFRWCALTITDKVEGERVIPLTPYVSRLLAALPRRNGWVFSSPSAKDGRIQDPREAHGRALKAAGLPHLTIHGLRRSFGTLCEWVEMPAGVVAQIQGHKPSATAEKHYRRRPLDLLRMWHIRAESWILQQAGIEIPAAEEQTRLRVV